MKLNNKRKNGFNPTKSNQLAPKQQKTNPYKKGTRRQYKQTFEKANEVLDNLKKKKKKKKKEENEKVKEKEGNDSVAAFPNNDTGNIKTRPSDHPPAKSAKRLKMISIGKVARSERAQQMSDCSSSSNVNDDDSSYKLPGVPALPSFTLEDLLAEGNSSSRRTHKENVGTSSRLKEINPVSNEKDSGVKNPRDFMATKELCPSKPYTINRNSTFDD